MTLGWDLNSDSDSLLLQTTWESFHQPGGIAGNTENGEVVLSTKHKTFHFYFYLYFPLILSLNWLQIWPPDGATPGCVTCIVALPWIALLALSIRVGIFISQSHIS